MYLTKKELDRSPQLHSKPLLGNGDSMVQFSKILFLGICRMGKSVTMEEARDMINAADKDGDGTVDFSEFVNFAASAH